jgi:hypothetical protein
MYVTDGSSIASVALLLLGFIGLATVPGWHTEIDERTGSEIDVKPFPSRDVIRPTAKVMDLGAFLLLVSAIWQHVAAASAASMISSAAQGQLTTHVGAGAVALVWVGFIMALIPAIGVEILITSISLLDELIDD